MVIPSASWTDNYHFIKFMFNISTFDHYNIKGYKPEDVDDKAFLITLRNLLLYILD